MAGVTEVDTAGTPARAASGPAHGVDPTLVGTAAAALVAGGGLTLAARHSAVALLVAIAIVQAAFAFAWVLGTGMPGRRGAIVLAALAAGGADTVVSVWPHGRLGTLLAVAGLAVPLLYVHQLSRGAARTRIVESMAMVAALVLAVIALASLLQLRHELRDTHSGPVATQGAIAAIGGRARGRLPGRSRRAAAALRPGRAPRAARRCWPRPASAPRSATSSSTAATTSRAGGRRSSGRRSARWPAWSPSARASCCTASWPTTPTGPVASQPAAAPGDPAPCCRCACWHRARSCCA